MGGGGEVCVYVCVCWGAGGKLQALVYDILPLKVPESHARSVKMKLVVQRLGYTTLPSEALYYY